MKKKRLLLLPLAALCALLLLCGFTVPDYSERLYVTDYSDVISSEHSADIIKYSTALKNACGAEIAVLTVKDLQGEDSAVYATETANEWGIGDKDKKNGILIVLATEDRKIQVAVGSGLEGRLNDGKVGRLIDNNAIDYLAENDFDNGVYALYKALLSETMAEYEITELEGYTAEPEEEGLPVWVVIMILAVFGLSPFWIPLFFGRGGRGGRGGGFHGGFRGGGGFGGGGGGSFGGGGFSGGGAGRSF